MPALNFTLRTNSCGFCGFLCACSHKLEHRWPRLTIRLLETWRALCRLQGGVLLQRFEFYKGLYVRKPFRNYSRIYLHFGNIIDLPQCLVIFSVFTSFLKPIWSLLGELWHFFGFPLRRSKGCTLDLRLSATQSKKKSLKARQPAQFLRRIVEQA